jgi:acyl-CoA thioester hydrolase
MSETFSRTFRARWSETNANGRVSLAGYLRCLVETAWDWGAAGGLSAAESEALGLAWVVRETELEIFRPTAANDVFDFAIWLVEWRRVRGTRCFELRCKEGDELIAQGSQQVATLDSKTLRPVRLPEHVLDNFLLQNPRAIEHSKFPKNLAQKPALLQTQRQVEWRDLDDLQHVNNATYADFAEQAAAQALSAAGWSPQRFSDAGLSVTNRRFHIQYQAPALWGDTLNVTVHLARLEHDGGAWFMTMERDADGQAIVKCLVEWVVSDRISATQQKLPDTLYHALKEPVTSS